MRGDARARVVHNAAVLSGAPSRIRHDLFIQLVRRASHIPLTCGSTVKGQCPHTLGRAARVARLGEPVPEVSADDDAVLALGHSPCGPLFPGDEDMRHIKIDLSMTSFVHCFRTYIGLMV